MNSMYPYKMFMYGVVVVWGTIGFIGDMLDSKSWDIYNIPPYEYALLNLCLTLGPIGSFIVNRIKHKLIALYLSVSCDLSIAFAIFAYTMLLLGQFGMVITLGFLWTISISNIAYAISDVVLIRLINTQSVEDSRSAEEIEQSITQSKVRSYIGLKKWEALIESSKGAKLYGEMTGFHQTFQSSKRDDDAQ